MDANGGFAPLEPGKEKPFFAPYEESWRLIAPIPDNAPAVVVRHGTFGDPSDVWTYRDSAGAVLGHICRFETPGGKEIRPRTLWADPEGEMKWRWASWTAPRPLYGLDRLAGRPDAVVIVVEGEKTADAASTLFPDFVVVSPPHGARSPHKADWSPLRGRVVIVWPDADGAGRSFARAVASHCRGADAADVRLVDVPTEWPEGWDLADELPDSCDTETLQRLIAEAQPLQLDPDGADNPPTGGVRSPFALRSDGVYFADETDNGREWKFVCSRLEIVALTRDADGREWGRLLVAEDSDGQKHDWAMPMAMLAGDGTAYREELLSLGLRIAPGRKAREFLQQYISTAQPTARVRCVTRTGWHGNSYVLPTATYGRCDERVILQTTTPAAHRIRTSGTLEEWQREVAELCVGNSRLAFAVACGFAATLLYPADEESGGFHFRGASSIGKTTQLRIAGSVWGGGGVNGYITTWRATSNGLEAVAAWNCDALLCLDELGQLAAREAGEVAYMLANGVGKSRAKRDGTARAPVTWRLLWLSTGEPSLAERMREAGQRVKAGQETRLVDIPADAGRGLGIFEELHKFSDGDRLARHLRDATARLYGVAIHDFLTRATSDVDALADAVRAGRLRWIESNCPKGADGQVVRVAARFGLVAAAGELATTMGILPWPDGEAQRSATACFRAWLAARGGIGAAEIAAAIAQVRAFVEAHGTSRFGRIDDPDHTVVNRVGFRRDDENGHLEYLVLAESWNNELCAGYDGGAVARALLEQGHLIPDGSEGKPQSRHRLPGLGTKRVYRLRASILDAES